MQASLLVGLVSLLAIGSQALAVGDEDQNLYASIALREGERIDIFVREDLSSVGYSIVNFSGGEGGTPRRAIRFEWLTLRERLKVEAAQDVLSSLRNLRKSAAQFPKSGYVELSGLKSDAQEFAREIAFALSLGQRVQTLPVQISSGFGGTPLKDAYRHILFESVRDALRSPMVQPTASGLATAFRATMRDGAARTAFWSELQRSLPAFAPDTFSGSDDENYARLMQLVRMAVGDEVFNPLALDCVQLLVRLR